MKEEKLKLKKGKKEEFLLKRLTRDLSCSYVSPKYNGELKAYVVLWVENICLLVDFNCEKV